MPAGIQLAKASFSHELNFLLSIASIYLDFVGLGLNLAPQRFGVDAVPTDPSAALIACLRLFGSLPRGLRSSTG